MYLVPVVAVAIYTSAWNHFTSSCRVEKEAISVRSDQVRVIKGDAEGREGKGRGEERKPFHAVRLKTKEEETQKNAKNGLIRVIICYCCCCRWCKVLRVSSHNWRKR